MSNDDDQYLEIRGVLHEIDLSPAGTATDPWPFLLTVRSGSGSSQDALVYEDDANQIIAFFQKHLPVTT